MFSPLQFLLLCLKCHLDLIDLVTHYWFHLYQLRILCLLVCFLRWGLLECRNIDRLLRFSILWWGFVFYYFDAVALSSIRSKVLFVLISLCLLLFPINGLESIAGLFFEEGDLVTAFKAILFIPLCTNAVSACKMRALSIDVGGTGCGVAEIALYHFLI